jgi:hypothetical protein
MMVPGMVVLTLGKGYHKQHRAEKSPLYMPVIYCKVKALTSMTEMQLNSPTPSARADNIPAPINQQKVRQQEFAQVSRCNETNRHLKHGGIGMKETQHAAYQSVSSA